MGFITGVAGLGLVVALAGIRRARTTPLGRMRAVTSVGAPS